MNAILRLYLLDSTIRCSLLAVNYIVYGGENSKQIRWPLGIYLDDVWLTLGSGLQLGSVDHSKSHA